MRDYFESLGESAHPTSSDSRARAITNFQELLLVSFREFSVITEETIASERKRFRTEIVTGIESFSKRAAVRNLKTMGRFTKDQAGIIYDVLFKAICEAPPVDVKVTALQEEANKDAMGRPETRIGLRTFRVFLSEVATWARDETIVSNGFQVSFYIASCISLHLNISWVYLSKERVDRTVADHEIIGRLFYFWDTSKRGALSFQVISLKDVRYFC
jgi:hypothetical protein